MSRIETTCLTVFLVLMVFTTFNLLKQIGDADIKGQVKSIVMYQHGIKSK